MAGSSMRLVSGEAKMFAKWHLDPSSHYATIHPATSQPTKTNNKQSSIAQEKAHLTVPVTVSSKNLRGRC